MNFVLVLAVLASPAMAKYFGSINVGGVGEVHVVGSDWVSGYIEMLDDGFQFTGGGGAFFANAAIDGWDPGMYWQVSGVLGRLSDF